MSNNLIPNFDSKIKPTKKQLTILNNVKKCKKIIDFLKLETKGRTTLHYGRAIRDFFIKLNIKDINNYFKDPRKMENLDKIDYLDTIEKHLKIFNNELDKSSGTNRLTNLSAIRMLLESNKIDLGNHFWKNIRKKGKSAETQTDIGTLSPEQLKNVLSHADTEALAIFLTQMTSGSRLESIITLEFEQLHLDKTPPQIKLYSEDEKNGKPISKPISTEAKEYLEKYKIDRTKNLDTRLNRCNHIKGKSEIKKVTLNKLKNKYKNRVFPMSEQNAETIWKNLLIKEHLNILDPKTNHPIYGTHSLIRYFEENIGNRNLSLYLRNKLPKSQSSYQFKTKNKLEEEYLKHEKNLYVFKPNSDIEEKLEDQSKKIKRLSGSLEIMTGFHKDEQERANKLYNRLTTIEKFLKIKIEENITNNPFIPKTKELLEMEEEIENITLRKHNYEVTEQYNKLIEIGEEVELKNIEGKLFIIRLTNNLKNFRELINKTKDKNIPLKERDKSKQEIRKILSGSIKSYTKEEQYIIDEVSSIIKSEKDSKEYYNKIKRKLY